MAKISDKSEAVFGKAKKTSVDDMYDFLKEKKETPAPRRKLPIPKYSIPTKSSAS